MQRNCPLVLVPAYGRIYRTAQDAVTDYLAGRDFKISGTSTYCSCRDLSGEKVYIGWKYSSSYEEVDTPYPYENGKSC